MNAHTKAISAFGESFSATISAASPPPPAPAPVEAAKAAYVAGTIDDLELETRLDDAMGIPRAPALAAPQDSSSKQLWDATVRTLRRSLGQSGL